LGIKLFKYLIDVRGMLLEVIAVFIALWDNPISFSVGLSISLEVSVGFISQNLGGITTTLCCSVLKLSWELGCSLLLLAYGCGFELI
jgi:hypothetical protein